MSLEVDAQLLDRYFKIQLPKYKLLSEGEKDLVFSLLDRYPNKFKYKSVVNFLAIVLFSNNVELTPNPI